MSEKRHRQQQRRQRRKAQGAARSPSHNSSPARLLAQAARMVIASIPDVTTAFEGEQLASSLMGTWRERALPGDDPDAVLFPGLVQALEAIGTEPALAALRALSAVGAPDRAPGARAAADRVAARGLPEAPWAADLGRSCATAAALVEEPAFDDGVNVMLEFDAEHTIGIYIDHNLGGLVKDVFLAAPLAEVRDELADTGEILVRDLDLAEARARVEAALNVLDHTFQPPVSENVHPLRALIEARLRTLPAGFELRDPYVEIAPEERETLLADFLASPEGRRWQGDDYAEDVARLAIDFGADYNHDGPLRWSPVVVEIFMTDWLPRKVLHEPAFFTRVPDVLPGWVRFAGRRRGVASGQLREAAAAVETYRAEFLEAAAEPGALNPVLAALRAGVDPADDAAVARFFEQYNRGSAG